VDLEYEAVHLEVELFDEVIEKRDYTACYELLVEAVPSVSVT
jgi:hypothetical protein